MPFLRDDLLEFVACVPPSAMMADGWHRGLLRAALKGHVPEALRMRRDKAWFEPALADVADAAGGVAALRELARVPRLAQLGIVEPGPFLREFERLARAPSAQSSAPLWSRVWQVLAAEAFAARLP
jgi:hypothetical protein